MSTRGAIGFRYNGKDNIAYNHSDSYPDGLGIDTVTFIERVNAEDGWKQLATKVANLSVIDDDADIRNLEGSPMLHAVYDGALTQFPDDADFMKDGLFNEYSYIINLDKMVLECFDSGNLLKTIGLSLVTREALLEVYEKVDGG